MLQKIDAAIAADTENYWVVIDHPTR